MKLMFVEARKKLQNEDKEQIEESVYEFSKKFPKIKSVGLLASLQYLDFLPFLREKLENSGIKTSTSKGTLTKYPCQVLGCDVNAAKNLENKVDSFILLSNGRFHALQIANATKKPIFIFDGGIQELNKGEIDKMKGKRLAAVKKFLAGNEIGIIVSTKHGQNKIEEALKIKDILEKKGRKAFLFVADTININELENFSCQSWINTACPALILDSSKIVNFDEIEKFL